VTTRLGLHFTAEELAIWQSRAVSGPYKTAGDVSTNSPGDWDRIATNAATFKNASHPYQQWAGQTTNTCVQPFWASQAPETNRDLARPMMDAAFYYLVKGDTAYSTPVRTDLLAQAAVAGTDFSNRSRWCQDTPYGPITDENPSFDISNWLTRQLYAYDYTKDTFSSGEKTTMNTWFLNAATYWVQQMDRWLTNAKYPGRDTDDYSSPTDSGVGGFELKKTHYGGFQCDGWTESWANRGTTHIRLGALVGVMLNDTYLKAQAKRYVKEWIKYNVFSDNTIGEMYRWDDTHPCLGWNYSSLILGSILTIADVFARTGDFELYNYSTSTGYDGTAGGPKTLLGITTLFAQYVNHTVTRYGTETAGNNGNANYIIDTVDGISGEAYSDDVNIANGNLYFNNSFIKSIYMRTASGAPAYPSGGGTESWQPWTGEWGTYPAMLFMFGQNEGVVNPFSLTSAAPNAPSGLTVHWV
jgi:hypothetical protein